MDIALVILRLLLASIFFTHATQKLLGWFSGAGVAGQSPRFEKLGLEPGRRYVLLAVAAELLASLLLLLGFLTPIGALAGLGTMLVAGFALQEKSKSFWNSSGGGEFAFVLAGVSLAVAFGGSGKFGLDAVLIATFPTLEQWLYGPQVGLIVAIIGVLTSLPFILLLRSKLRSAAEEVQATSA